MTIISLSVCPQKIRGDLSKWLIEIDTGVYCGHINTRIREKIWERIIDNIGEGHAVMVFSAQNEQHMDFRVYNMDWNPVDYDGISLVRRNHPTRIQSSKKKTEKSNVIAVPKNFPLIKTVLPAKDYTIIDIETTGLSIDTSEIIELAALKIRSQLVISNFSKLIQIDKTIPAEIVKLTGIDNQLLIKEGICIDDALNQFILFLGTDILVGHNIDFDLSFINKAITDHDMSFKTDNTIDTLKIARTKIRNITNYKMKTLLDYFSITREQTHRALDDCYLTLELYNKLNEI